MLNGRILSLFFVDFFYLCDLLLVEDELVYLVLQQVFYDLILNKDQLLLGA